MGKKEQEQYTFRECTRPKLEKWFGLRQSWNSPVLDKWLAMKPTLVDND